MRKPAFLHMEKQTRRSFVAIQPGLWWTWSETMKTGFDMTWLLSGDASPIPSDMQ